MASSFSLRGCSRGPLSRRLGGARADCARSRLCLGRRAWRRPSRACPAGRRWRVSRRRLRRLPSQGGGSSSSATCRPLRRAPGGAARVRKARRALATSGSLPLTSYSWETGYAASGGSCPTLTTSGAEARPRRACPGPFGWCSRPSVTSRRGWHFWPGASGGPPLTCCGPGSLTLGRFWPPACAGMRRP